MQTKVISTYKFIPFKDYSFTSGEVVSCFSQEKQINGFVTFLKEEGGKIHIKSLVDNNIYIKDKAELVLEKLN